MKASAVHGAVDRTLQQCPFELNGAVLVCGLSGGPDSVALLHALRGLATVRGFRIVAAHLDHCLRPDSADDGAFCDRLCEQLGVAFESARADVRARSRVRREGLEAAAREERYAFLRAVCARRSASAIAVAHTRDDQAETVLLRLLRGAGGTGLAAMRLYAGDVIRPLLTVSRADVLDYLAAHQLSWREDPSNQDRTLLRNRIRHELLPYLEHEYNPRLRMRLASTAALLADEDDLLDGMAARLLPGTTAGEQGGVALSRSQLANAPRALARRAVRLACARAGAASGLSAALVERMLTIAGTARASGRRLPLPAGCEARFEFDVLRIGPRSTPARWAEQPLSVPGRVDLPGGWTVSATACSTDTPASPAPAHVGAEEAEGLVVRTRRPGDRVRVGGREISLKRFFCQRRVPFGQRAALPLVAAGDRVVWIAGQRLDSCGCGPRRVHIHGGRANAQAWPSAPHHLALAQETA